MRRLINLSEIKRSYNLLLPFEVVLCLCELSMSMPPSRGEPSRLDTSPNPTTLAGRDRGLRSGVLWNTQVYCELSMPLSWGEPSRLETSPWSGARLTVRGTLKYTRQLYFELSASVPWEPSRLDTYNTRSGPPLTDVSTLKDLIFHFC